MIDAGAYGSFFGDDTVIAGGRFTNHLSPRSPANDGFTVTATRPDGSSIELTFAAFNGPTSDVGVATINEFDTAPLVFDGRWGGFSYDLTRFRATFSILFDGELVVGEVRIG